MGVKFDCDLYKQMMSLKNLIKNEPNLGRWLIHLYQQLQNNRVSVISSLATAEQATSSSHRMGKKYNLDFIG